MKTISEINAGILKIVTKIKEVFPELSKYTDDIPDKNSDKNNSEINIKELKYYTDSLYELLKKHSITHSGATLQASNKNKKQYNGYSSYPSEDDIYNKFKEETDINPEDISEMKSPNDKEGILNEKNFTEASGSDLDIPGSELDDTQEDIGSEDEENNYYSIGGDNHDNLEEDIGDVIQ